MPNLAVVDMEGKNVGTIELAESMKVHFISSIPSSVAEIGVLCVIDGDMVF